MQKNKKNNRYYSFTNFISLNTFIVTFGKCNLNETLVIWKNASIIDIDINIFS